MHEDLTPEPSPHITAPTGSPVDQPDPAPGESSPPAHPPRSVADDADADWNQELDHWKERLREEFEEWLAGVDSIPKSPAPELRDSPDLYSFYEQLAVGTAESRKSNRRTVEAFGQWGETLTKFDGDLRLLREQLNRLPVVKDDDLPRSWCLALAEILDRALRLRAAFSSPPPASWWGRSVRWQQAWKAQQQGFDILVSHLEELLKKAGVTRLIALQQPFDAMTMSAVAAEPNLTLPHHTVTEEIAPGYRWNDELLRVAQVKISTRNSGVTSIHAATPPSTRV